MSDTAEIHVVCSKMLRESSIAVLCGSIGSLGDTPEQVAVRNITVKGAALAGTTNGLRIKTWAKANAGAVTGVSFSGVVMRNVSNPIIVDQNYCPGNASCPTEARSPETCDLVAPSPWMPTS